MKIALIGPGIMLIPPQGWGAVESLIWNYKVYLEKMGHEVEIFNSSELRKVAEAINNNHYDFIHGHYDENIEDLNRLLKKPYCNSTHFGFFSNTEQWGDYYWKIYFATLRSPGIIALSNKVVTKYRCDGYRGFLGTLKNGAECERLHFKKQNNGRAICLGRIDRVDRKSQVLLSKLLGDKVPIDFVGPSQIKNFQPGGLCHYLGEWDKDTVYQQLTEYSCMVLISHGELAPLVIPEAMAAGLSIVVSKAASANLDPKPFISVIPDGCRNGDILAKAIRDQINTNENFRDEIRGYAEECFDWSVIMNDYLKLIERFNAKPRTFHALPLRPKIKKGVWRLWESFFLKVFRKVRTLLRFLLIYLQLVPNRFVQEQSCESAAIIFIGTNKYINFFRGYYEACQRHFLPKTKKTYFVFTNEPEHSFFKGKKDVVLVNIPAQSWPFPTLFRFKYINSVAQKLNKYSHLIFMDADMLVTTPIGEKEFFSHSKPLFGVQHPFHTHNGTFERNPQSLACVSGRDAPDLYYQACLWGGKTSEALMLSKELERRIDDDLSRNVIAVWHDESHLNKYFMEHKNDVHAYPSDYAAVSFWSARILHQNIGYATFTAKKQTVVTPHTKS